MILANGLKKSGWVCCKCGESVLYEPGAEAPEPGICPVNSTEAEEKPHTWRFCYCI